MDKQEVRRLALLGAAKVAFSATLAGCGGIVVYESASGERGAGGAGDTHVKPVPWGTATATSATTATTATTTSTGQGQCSVYGPPYTPSATACCDALVEAAFPDWGAPVPSPDPGLVACCDVVLSEAAPKPTTASASSSSSGVPYVAIERCCTLPGVSPKPQPLCTPWGPPVPPAMIEGLDWVEEAA